MKDEQTTNNPTLDELRAEAQAALAVSDPELRTQEVQRVTLRYLAALGELMRETHAAVA